MMVLFTKFQREKMSYAKKFYITMTSSYKLQDIIDEVVVSCVLISNNT